MEALDQRADYFGQLGVAPTVRPSSEGSPRPPRLSRAQPRQIEPPGPPAPLKRP